jgi:hypothetical protein
MMEVPLHPRLRKFNFKGHLSHCTVKKKPEKLLNLTKMVFFCLKVI